MQFQNTRRNLAVVPSTMIKDVTEDPEFAKFMWGDGGVIPHIDDLNNKFGLNPLHEAACAIRFSIGAIMFERKLWKEMKGFKVIPFNYRLGIDEEQLNAFCVNNTYPMMVSENIVVGHFSFGLRQWNVRIYG